MEHLFSENISAHLLLWVILPVAAIQIAFMAWVSVVFRRRSAGMPLIADLPAISVIVCARNEEFNLKKHLPAWLGQEYQGEWELVVVDDDSTDGTAAVVQAFQHEHTRLHLVSMRNKEHAGKKQALATGIRSAAFDWLLFTDADCRPAGTGWIRGMAAHMSATRQIRIVTGYGPLETPTGFFREWPRWEAVHTAVLYVAFTRAGVPYMGVGRNLAVHRSVYNAVGGFRSHEHIASGDDDLLVNAAADSRNTTVCLDPETFMYSAGKTTFKDWYRQKKRHLSAGAHYRLIHQTLLALLAGTHVLYYIAVVLLLFIAPIAALALWVVRAVACAISFRHVLGVLKAGDLYPYLLLYDALTAVYYGVFAGWEVLRSLRSKKGINETW